MFSQVSGAGLSPDIPSPPFAGTGPERQITEEAGLCPPSAREMRVTLLVETGASVPQGAAVACLRDHPEIVLTAPMPARVARVDLAPGRKLSEIVLYREDGGDRMRHDVADAMRTDASLRALLGRAGLWPLLNRRPFGGLPAPDERASAIVVMASDTRPHAPDPRQALAGRDADFRRGLDALGLLTDGPVLVCRSAGPTLFAAGAAQGRAREVVCGPRHPQGLAGFRIHDLWPASIAAPVWDIHAEDVAAIGALLDTGYVPETRLVAVAGGALREARLVHTQPGADLRGLTARIVRQGPHRLLSGSPLDGEESHWLRPRDRQASALPGLPRPRAAHWFRSALTRSALPAPIIPTAALTQAMGGAVPAAALLRALAAGDDEAAIGLGALSLLEEDMALADYATGGGAHLGLLLRRMLDRVETEFAP